MRRFGIGLMLCAGLAAMPALAGDGIYRWQDSQGRWQFSNHAEVDPNQKPAPPPRARLPSGRLAAPGTAVLRSPDALQGWLLRLKSDMGRVPSEQENRYLAHIRWPQGPVLWRVRVQEIVNTDLLRPELGRYQIRARTLSPVATGGLPVVLDGELLHGAGAPQVGELLQVRGQLSLHPDTLRLMDRHGFVYYPVQIVLAARPLSLRE